MLVGPLKIGDLVRWSLTGDTNDPGAVCLVIEAISSNNAVQLLTPWGELHRVPVGTGSYSPYSVEAINEGR